MDIVRITADAPAEVFEELSALDRSCFGAEGWTAKAFSELAERDGGAVLAAYIGDELAGLFAGFTAADTGEVLTLVTAPEHRRNGVARLLLSEFLSSVPDETETIALEVRQSNTAAVGLYRSLGFEKAGVRRRFYSDPDEDADIMVKNISSP